MGGRNGLHGGLRQCLGKACPGAHHGDAIYHHTRQNCCQNTDDPWPRPFLGAPRVAAPWRLRYDGYAHPFTSLDTSKCMCERDYPQHLYYSILFMFCIGFLVHDSHAIKGGFCSFEECVGDFIHRCALEVSLFHVAVVEGHIAEGRIFE